MRSPTAYRALLMLLPRRFRARFGAEMEDLFAFRLSRARGRAGRGRVWVAAALDVLLHAVLLRLGANTDEGRRKDMGNGMQDLRYALRTLGTSPLSTAIAVLTLALGIGASTATYSVVGAVLFKPLPYPDPDRLVVLWPELNFNNAMLRDAVASMPAVEEATGISGWRLALVGEGEPLEVEANRVSPAHFRVLGADAALGRTFSDEEGLPGRSGVVVLSHAFWVRVFGADPRVIGRTLRLSGADSESHRVIGIMPPDFRPVRGHPEVWIPMTLDPGATLESDDSWYVNSRIARLAPGATLEQANEQVSRFARSVGDRLNDRFSAADVRGADVRPLSESLAGGMQPVMWAALLAVSLVLLIACANVTSVLLSRGEARARELAVRAALGAEPGRITRMLLTESGLIGLLGGAVGVIAALGLVRILLALAPSDFPRARDIAVDGPVLLWAVGVTVLATALAGLVPALRAGRVDATSSLGGAARAGSARRLSRLSLALVGAEVGLAMVVTIGSGLMVRSLLRLTSMDTGLETRGVLVLRASPPEERYADRDEFQGYWTRVLERVEALPAAASAGAIHLLPGTNDNWNFPTLPEGVDAPEGTPIPTVNFRIVRVGYFESVGLRPLQGRLFGEADGADAEKVMIVNQAFVNRFWPGSDPIGRSVRLFSDSGDAYRVAGVIGDVRQHGLAREPEPEMYFSQEQLGWNVGLWVVVRLRGDRPLEHAASVRDAVWSVDPDVPISGLGELSDVFDASASSTRFLTVVLGSFGVLALVLGALGVFGVTTHAVGRRTAEFGVRLALGASRRGVLLSALSTCAVPIAVGLLLGIAAASVSSGLLRSALFGVEPSDPPTYAGVAALLLAAAAAASLVPAWRASRVDPVRVLGSE